jgi:hypothetical protein
MWPTLLTIRTCVAASSKRSVIAVPPSGEIASEKPAKAETRNEFAFRAQTHGPVSCRGIIGGCRGLDKIDPKALPPTADGQRGFAACRGTGGMAAGLLWL